MLTETANEQSAHHSRSRPRRTAQGLQPGLVGLGLGKMHRVVEVEDTPEVRGAIAKLPHMVEVVG